MELTLFIIVGAIAVAAAAMMLISENAVHSALFLILNFACIAFFFLMLNAPFLAMVQIVVYAGAIMVLFLFVIMLLGAELLGVEKNPRFPWLTPVAVVLALVFLITTGLAIIQGDVNLEARQTEAPVARVVHAIDSVEAIDVYLDGDRIASDLGYGEHTDFATYDAGRYELAIYGAGEDVEQTEPLISRPVDLTLGQAITLAAIGTPDAPLVTVAAEDVEGVERGDDLRLMVVNAFPEAAQIDVVNGANDEEGDLLIGDVAYGEASESVEVSEGTYTVSVYADGEMRTRLLLLRDQTLESQTATLWLFTMKHQPDNSWDEVVIDLESKTRASFGSPAFVGQQLFRKYVLPLEVVALVLLVAMIGAIVLTKESLGPRSRPVRRLANPPAGLEQPIIGDPDKSR